MACNKTNHGSVEIIDVEALVWNFLIVKLN
jgi:hypothetical protein